MSKTNTHVTVVVATVVLTVDVATVVVEVTLGAEAVATGTGNFDVQKVCASGKRTTAEATTPIMPLQVADSPRLGSARRSVVTLKTCRGKTMAKVAEVNK